MVARPLRGLDRFEPLAFTALVWFLGKFLRYAFPPLFETLGVTYGASRTALGTAFTGFMLVYAAMQFPSGLFADRLGSVRMIAGGSILTAVGALALVVDSPFVVLAGAMLLMGAGTGTYKTVAVRLLSRTYPAQTGRVLGIFDTFGSFGGVAAPAVVVLVAGLSPVFGAPWRTLFLVSGVASVGLAIAVAVRVPSYLESGAATGGRQADPGGDGRARDDGSASVWAYLALFRRWQFTVFVAVTLLFSFAYNGAVAFLPLYLTSETVLTSATANLLFSALFVVSLVQLVTGEASDRLGSLPVIVLALGVATAGLVAVIAFSATGGPFVLGGAVVALGLGAHGFRPVRGAYLMTVIPDSVSGGSFGVARTLLMGAGAVAPAVVGYLSETVGFRTAFGVLAASLAGALVLAVGLLVVAR
jgi:MFS family permease